MHSIGVILFRNNKETVFNQFVKDITQKIKILTLSEGLYSDLAELTTDPAQKGIFLQLAQEEARHKLRFEIEYDDFILQEN